MDTLFQRNVFKYRHSLIWFFACVVLAAYGLHSVRSYRAGNYLLKSWTNKIEGNQGIFVDRFNDASKDITVGPGPNNDLVRKDVTVSQILASQQRLSNSIDELAAELKAEHDSKVDVVALAGTIAGIIAAAYAALTYFDAHNSA